MLGLALVSGRATEVTDSATDLAAGLDRLPKQFGQWQCVQATHPKGKQTRETAAYDMLFRNDKKQEVWVQFLATRTRLGSLRDFSLATMGQGWVLGQQTQWRAGSIEGLPSPMVAGVRDLTRQDQRRLCITWYVSPTSQTADFTKAELLGWKERLLGHNRPWAQMYVVSSFDGTQAQMVEAAKEVAVNLAPALYGMLKSASQG